MARVPFGKVTSTGLGLLTAAGHPGQGVTPSKAVISGPHVLPLSVERRNTRLCLP
mgnify:CR=1 FL=1